jgi:MoxR-like ATPase
MEMNTNLMMRNRVYTIDFNRPKETNEALLDFFKDAQEIKGNNEEFYHNIIKEIESRGTKLVDPATVQLAKSLEEEIRQLTFDEKVGV